MTKEEIPGRIRAIQEEIGVLPRTIRALLLTDGSVTTLLEAITDDTVTVRTVRQEVVPATGSLAKELRIDPGDPVNHRVVELLAGRQGTVLIYAVSDTPVGRLDRQFREDLMKADIPIGKILASHRLETRREIVDVRLLPRDPALAGIFGIAPAEPLISRKYHIIHRDLPLIAIEEIYPARIVPGTIRAGSVPGRLVIRCPSRLHIGLIDLCGGLGRVDGGIGLAIADPFLALEATIHDSIEITARNPGLAAKIRQVAERVIRQYGIGGGARIALLSEIPTHAGLGSGTQVALATARAVCRLHRIDASARELARIAGRGGTSGIGTAAFETGGFIVDGGHRFGGPGGKSGFLPSSASTDIPPAAVTVREEFPEDWKVFLVIPEGGSRVSGAQELDHFKTYCPLPAWEVQEVCHQLVVRILPGIVEHDLALFSAGVNRFSEIGFKRVEIALQDPFIPGLIGALRQAGAPCAGMSSFGPAVYAVTDGDTAGLEQAARKILGKRPASFFHTRGINRGAVVREFTGRD